MHLLKNYWLTLFCILLSEYISLFKAQDPASLDVYVNNQQITSPRNGSKEYPFGQLSDALNAINALPTPLAQVNVYIAPSSDSYELAGSTYDLDGLSISALMITIWENGNQIQDPDQSQPDPQLSLVVDFTESHLSVTNGCSLVMMNLSIIAKDNLMLLSDSSITLKAVDITAQFESSQPFVIVKEGHNVILTDISVKLSGRGSMIEYSPTTDAANKPLIQLTNITMNFDRIQEVNQSNYSANRALFNLSGVPNNIVGDIIITGFTIESQEQDIAIQPQSLVVVKYFQTMSLSDVTINSQNINLAAYSSPLISVTDITNVTINGLNISKSLVSTTSEEDLALTLVERIQDLTIQHVTFAENKVTIGSQISLTLVRASDIANLNLLDQLIGNNMVSGDIVFFDFPKNNVSEFSSVDISITINNLTVTGNNNSLDENQFIYLNFQGATITKLLISEIMFSENNLVGGVFSIRSYNPDFNTDLSLKSLSLTDVSFINNYDTSNLTLLSFSLHEDKEDTKSRCSQPVEPYMLLIQNLTVSNNTFSKFSISARPIYEAGLFQISQTQVTLNASNIAGNLFYDYSLLIVDTHPSSILIFLSNFTGNNLTFSQFVATTPQALDTFCTYIEDNPYGTVVPLYRYSFIIESVFSQNQLETSALLSLNNGYIALHNNTIDNLTLTNSQLITAKFATANLGMRDIFISRDETIEAEVFGINPVTESTFDEIKSKIKALGLYNTYFCSIIGNNFTNINFNALSLLSISGFSFKQSLIHVEANLFSEIHNKNRSLISSVFNSELFSSIIISGNTFSHLYGHRLFIFSLQSDETTILDFEMNSINASSFASFLTYTGDNLYDFKFSNNDLNDTVLFRSYVYLSIQAMSDSFVFDANTVNNTNLTVDSRKSQDDRYAFIFIFCEKSSDQSEIVLSNNVFSTLRGSIYYMINPLIHTNIMIIQTQQPIVIRNMTLSTITVKSVGSIMDISTSSSFYIQDSTFNGLQIKESSGLIKLAAPETIISNLQVNGASVTYGPGLFAMKAFLPEAKLKIANSSFTEISSNTRGALFTGESISSDDSNSDNSLKLDILNCSFISPLGRIVYLSGLYCENCTVQDVAFNFQYSTQMFGFVEQATGVFYLTNLSLSIPFYNTDYLVEMEKSDIVVVVSSLIYNGEKADFKLAQLDYGALVVLDSIFQNIELSTSQMILVRDYEQDTYPWNYVNAPIVYVENTTFSNIDNEYPIYFDPIYINTFDTSEVYPNLNSILILATMPANITVKNCTFSDSKDIQSVLLYLNQGQNVFKSTNASLQIQDSIFENYDSSAGSLVAVFSQKDSVSVEINNTVFENNNGRIGTAIMAFNTSINITNCNFTNNTASDVGANAYLGGKFNENFNVTNTTFLNEKGVKEAGITYDSIDFTIHYLRSDNSTNIQLLAHNATDRVDYNFFNVSTNDLTSTYNYFVLNFTGPDGKPAPELSQNPKITIEILENMFHGKQRYFDMTITEQSRYSLQVPLSNLIIAGKANDFTTLRLEYNSDRISVEKLIFAHIRPCLAGEYNNSGFCQTCPENSYSLKAGSKCYDCPSYMRCLSQSRLCPVPDYWNANDQSITLYPCSAGRCPNNQGCQTCTTGYTGPLCNACDFANDYVESGYLQCGKCDNPKKSLALSITIMILLFLYDLFSIYAIYTGNNQRWNRGSNYLVERNLEQSFYIKTLLTFTQLMSILYMTSSDMYTKLGLLPEFGSASTLITYGTECSMIALGIEPSKFLYYETLLIALVPIIKLMITIILVLIMRCFKQTEHPGKVIGVAALFFILSNQPGVISNIGLFISCKTLDGLDYSFVASHPNWKCYTAEYNFYANNFAIPSLVFYCAIVPITLLVVLCINRNRINTQEIKTSLGMLLSDVQDNRYYWSIVLIILKLTISLMVFSLEQKDEVQIFISLVVLWTYQSLVRILKPYNKKQFNKFEVILINLLMFNLVANEYLVAKASGSYIRPISMVIAVILNVMFIVFVLWKIFSLAILNIVAFVEKTVMKRRVSRIPLIFSEQNESLINAQEM